jgi:hypothetical protein
VALTLVTLVTHYPYPPTHARAREGITFGAVTCVTRVTPPAAELGWAGYPWDDWNVKTVGNAYRKNSAAG